MQLYSRLRFTCCWLLVAFACGFCLLTGCFSGVTAQSLPINFLFRPNAWVGYEHLGPAGLPKNTVTVPSPYVGLTVPLYTSVGIKRGPFNAEAHQIMGNFYGRYQQAIFSGLNDSLHQTGTLARKVNSSYVATAGFIGVKAGLNSGIWVYGARTTIAVGTGSFTKPAVNVLGAVARAKLKGLHKGYLYGIGIFASQDLVLPIPAFGYYYKPYKEITFYIMFPVQMRLSYQATENFNIAYQSTLSARPAIVEIQTTEGTRAGRFNSLGYRHGIVGNLKPKKHMNIFAEAGYMLPQQIGIADLEAVDYFAKPTWYFDISIMHSLGDKLFDSPLGQF